MLRRILALLGILTVSHAAAPEIRQVSRDEVRIAWPVVPPAVLEERRILETGVGWEPVATAPVTEAGFNVLRLEPSGSERFFRLREIPARIATGLEETSPAAGESGVAVTRETIVRFSRALAAGTKLGVDKFHASAGGRLMLSRVELSADRRAAILFFLEYLPGSSRVEVTLECEGLVDADGVGVDGDGDGLPGGTAQWSFDTSGVSGLAGTAVVGHVFASERRNGTNVPLVGVTVTVDGAEETLRTRTGADGSFRLEPAPAGRFFVHVDGRTAEGSRWPGGAYYPFVGKAWEAVPGKLDNLAGGSGEVFLPLVPAGALQAIRVDGPTEVSFTPAVVAADPRLAGVRLEVPANALFSESGARGGRLGMAPVAPDRLPEPLPQGLNPALVITVQSDGAMNFDRPVPIRFPNLPDPLTGERLGPGEKTAIWSFNHDTGRWEVSGPATVSADGQFVDSDPGTGLRQPGWSFTAPGTQPSEPGGGAGGDARESEDCNGGDIFFNGVLDVVNCGADLVGLNNWVGTATRLVSDLRDYAGVADRMVNATATPGGSCERATVLFSLVNVLGRTAADIARPFVAEADPTRLAAAGVNCTVATARNAARLLCFTRCREGATTAERCQQMDAIAGAGDNLRLLTETDLHASTSATGLAIDLAQNAGNILDAQLRDSCTRGGGGPVLMDFDPDLSVLRRRVIEHAAALSNLVAHCEELLAIGTAIRDGLAEEHERGARAASGWMIQDRAWAGSYYRITAIGLDHRERVSASGEFRLPILRSGRAHVLEVYEPTHRVYGRVGFIAAGAGQITRVPVPQLQPLGDPVRFPDADADRLPDAVEEVVGTRIDRNDTDGDGLADATELAEGGNPMAASAEATGVLASIPLGAPAVDLVEVSPEVVAVATGLGRVELFSTAVPGSPVRIASIEVGTRGLRMSSDQGILLVKEEYTGFRAYDVSTASRPRLLWRRDDFAFQLDAAFAVRGDQAFAVLGGNLVCWDALSGTELFRIPYDSAPESMVVAGGRVCVLGANGLQVFDVDGARFQARGSLALPWTSAPAGAWGRSLSGNESILFAGSDAGFMTIGMGSSGVPALLGAAAVRHDPVWKLAMTDERTVAAVVVLPGNSDSVLGIHDVGDLSDVTRRFAVVDTPGSVAAVLLHAGRLFVADGHAGLTVLSRFGSVPTGEPALRLTVQSTSATAQQGGAPYVLRAALTGSGAQGRVEYYVGGTRVGQTLRFPHLWRDHAPAVGPAGGSLSFIARATLHSGLVLTSAPVTLPLLADAVPPVLVERRPGVNGVVLEGLGRELAVVFNEELDPATVVASSLTLIRQGPDGFPGSDDDVPVTGGELAYARSSRTIRWTLPAPLEPGLYQARLAGSVADRQGNASGSAQEWFFRVASPRRWISDLDGQWQSPANWSGGRIPAMDEFVVIDRAGADPVVTVPDSPFGVVRVDHLTSRDRLRVIGSLQTSQGAILEGPVELVDRGSLRSELAPVVVRSELVIRSAGGGPLGLLELNVPGRARVELPTGATLLLANPAGSFTRFVTTPSGVFEMNSAGEQTIQGALATFLNGGVFRARAVPAGTNSIAGMLFDNAALLEALSGDLVLRGGALNRGRMTVARGARLHLGDGMAQVRSTPASSISGEGDVVIAGDLSRPNLRLIRGTIDVGGSLSVVGGSVHLAASRIDVGMLDVSASEARFEGLAVHAGTLVLRDGGQATFASGTEPEFDGLDSATGPQSFTEGGNIDARVPVNINGPARVGRVWVRGTRPVRFLGPLQIVNSLSMEPETQVEIGSTVDLGTSANISMSFNSELTLLPSATVEFEEGTFVTGGGTLVNQGTLRTPEGLAGPVFVNPELTVNRGLIDLRGGRVRFTRMLQETGGVIRVGAGTLSSTADVELAGGELTGDGLLSAHVQNTGGTISPGADGVGRLRFGGPDGGGRWVQSGTGRLLLDVTGPGVQDVVSLTGEARLGGILEVRTAPAYDPALDTEHVVVTASTVSGEFSEVRLPVLPSGRRMRLVYEPTRVLLRVVLE